MNPNINWKNFNREEFDKLAFAARATQLIFVGTLCALVLAAMAWFLVKPTIENVKIEAAKEEGLRNEFAIEQAKAANLEAYRAQLKQMEINFQAMVEQLPNESQIEGLLREVADLGNESGLKIKTFRPLEEKSQGFYTEHAIELVVTGNFAEFTTFASALANTSRIVNMQDYRLALESNQISDGDLSDEIRGNLKIATYRYTGDSQ